MKQHYMCAKHDNPKIVLINILDLGKVKIVIKKLFIVVVKTSDLVAGFVNNNL